MSSSPKLLKLKIHHGDATAVTLLPLADMTIESVLEIAALEFPAPFSAAAASSDMLSLFSFGSSGDRFTEITSTALLHSLFLKLDSARVYVVPLAGSRYALVRGLIAAVIGICLGPAESKEFRRCHRTPVFAPKKRRGRAARTM
jgi:hypothetical protein